MTLYSWRKSPYSESNPIPQGLSLVPGLVYRIQLGVFSKAKPNDAFGGISPVSYEQVTGSNNTQVLCRTVLQYEYRCNCPRKGAFKRFSRCLCGGFS